MYRQVALTRRIVVSACALSLAIPAASPAADSPKAQGPYGVPAKVDPRDVVKAKGPYGTTATGPRNVVEARGPYGPTTTRPRYTVKAQGPFGATVSTVPRAMARPAGATSHDDPNGWRTAAISEAGLLAALALGSSLALSARHRSPRLGT
jgi:hypothetical protein